MQILSLCDNPDMDDVPNFSIRQNCLQRLFIWLIMPFMIMWGGIKQLAFTSREINGIKNPETDKTMHCLKNMSISPDIPLVDVKKRSKELKCSINELIFAVISKSMKDYLVHEAKDSKTESLIVAVPFSIREMAKHVNDYTFDN